MSQDEQAERRRLREDASRQTNWKRWGTYLPERQWATVREDYSVGGDAWAYFPHDHARSRVYRWGEDGLLGWCDRECRLCFALALWNGRDPILKERLFGLTNPEGNHGEDVKECYFYLDSTPTHSYAKALYKYPQAAFPYDRLVAENARRGRDQPEFELLDSGALADGRYFDVFVEYAKAGPDDTLIRLTVVNRADAAAELDVLAQLWFRNTWASGSPHEPWGRPVLRATGEDAEQEETRRHGEREDKDREQDIPGETSAASQTRGILAEHGSLGGCRFQAGAGPDGRPPELLFTENETNVERIFGGPNPSPYVKDSFHRYLIDGDKAAVNPARMGTKAAARYHLRLEPGEEIVLRLRLMAAGEGDHGTRDQGPAETTPVADLGEGFDLVFRQRQAEADEFYAGVIPAGLPEHSRQVIRQAYAGLLWNKQFYFYVVKDWLAGDPLLPPPPAERRLGRNNNWPHLFNRNVMSMPDKWEYPWYASWDLGFHAVALAGIDPELAKEQLVLLLREWFLHPNGKLPAYEYDFSAVNPPVHAWACWRVYKMTGPRGGRDRMFLARTFQKLLLDFTWWVNRKDVQGRQIFSGGFLGMDNIGIFDRGQLPPGADLAQADGTAWVAFFCATMLSIALELAREDPAYEDMASKFFTHFVGITDAVNCLGGGGLWDEADGLYYDQIIYGGQAEQLRVHSLVSLLPLIAVEVIDDRQIGHLTGFMQRLHWFLDNRRDLAGSISYMACQHGQTCGRRLLAIPSRERLARVLARMLDEDEFLSPHGLRSLSRWHRDRPCVFQLDGREYRIGYEPGESATDLMGGNSNWRGPVWLPVNYLLIEALEKYDYFYGDSFKVECPTGSGNAMTLGQVARELRRRLCTLFEPDAAGRCPWQGASDLFARDRHWQGLHLFYEYFHGETGQGLGASHQTGWTALIARLLADDARTGGKP